MTSTSSPPAGQSVVPVHQLEAILDTLTQVAAQLEAIASALDSASQLRGTADVQGKLERRVEEELLANLCRGKESIGAAALAKALSDIMADEGIQLSVNNARRMLPTMMLCLFGAKMSCSIRGVSGRYVRGYRGVAFRAVSSEESSPT